MNNPDVVIIGGGAAGLMAAIWAARMAPGTEVLVLDCARKLGAKILVSGGGRCNVTHERVTESDFAGSTPNAIRKVLRRFQVPDTVAFFRELGIELKREETGKLFPTTDSARSVLQALLEAAEQAGVKIQHPRRVEYLNPMGSGFRAGGEWGQVSAAHAILATGGKSLPKSGSDGHGYAIAQSLGHSLTPHILPALVPLTLPSDHFCRGLTGLTVPARLEVQDNNRSRLATFTDSTLCTHFGLSGPSILNISRYYLHARLQDPDTRLVISWLPSKTSEELDAEIRRLGKTKVINYLKRLLPGRLAQALIQQAGIDDGLYGYALTRRDRLLLVKIATRMELPVVGDRGFGLAEVTAGGVPLKELHLETMESRACPGLFLCGEICDVDGRIGGFNFQWAWSSGFVAGVAVGNRLKGQKQTETR